MGKNKSHRIPCYASLHICDTSCRAYVYVNTHFEAFIYELLIENTPITTILIEHTLISINLGKQTTYVTGPAKIGHVGSQNLSTFQTFVTHNVLLQHGVATQFSEIAHNLTGFLTHLTEQKYYISVLKYVSSNHMIYFSPHALFSQARSHIKFSSYAGLHICGGSTYKDCQYF